MTFHRSNPNSFRIGAAAAMDETMDTVGDADDLNFVSRGHEAVFINWYEEFKHTILKKFEAQLGLSPVTTLTAGLAPLMMGVWLSLVYANDR